MRTIFHDHVSSGLVLAKDYFVQRNETMKKALGLNAISFESVYEGAKVPMIFFTQENIMPCTRSTTRRNQAAGNNVTVSPSATGHGTHIHWRYPEHPITSSLAVPDLSQSGSSSSDNSFTQTPATPPSASASAEAAFDYVSLSENRIISCGMRALQAHKQASDERVRQWNNEGDYFADEDIPEDDKEEEEVRAAGLQLPRGIKGLGPEGTFLVSDEWHTRPSENDKATTDQLPVVNKEYMEVENISPGVPQGGQADDVVAATGGLPEFVGGW
jgi:hypothetical protein